MTSVRSPDRVLAVRLHGLGDALLTTPALRAARRAWPQARLVMLVGRRAFPAVAGNPHLDDVIDVDERLFFAPRPWGLLRLACRLRRERFDLALLFSRSRLLRLWARLAGARQVVGATRQPAGAGAAPDWRAAEYEAQANLALVTALGVAPRGLELDLAVPKAAHARAEALLGDHPGRGLLALAPGGGKNAAWRMPQKRWPVDRFAAVADAAGERFGLRAVIVGDPDDRPLAEEIASRTARPLLDACGEELTTSAAIIERARVLVCNDSVAMHLGLVVGTPFVALFGPTNPRAVLPPAGAFQVVRPEPPCSPCFWQAKPRIRPSAGRGDFPACPSYECSCLQEVPVDEVVEAAARLLSRTAPGVS